MNHYSAQYRKALLEDVVPFWMDHSVDMEVGGFYTCLDQKGHVYDTDKFMWLQARQVWTFSFLYSYVEPKKDWIEIARHGIRFLEKHGRDTAGAFYFSLNREGVPLMKPYSIFSDCFAAMAYFQFGKSTGDDHYVQEAGVILQNILRRQDQPKGLLEKSTGNRPLKDFALPMILSNLVLMLDSVMPAEDAEELINRCARSIFLDYFDEQTGLIHEYVKLNGEKEDSFNGRLINPGHILEAMWFLMDIGERNNDRALIDKCIETGLHHLEFGWDKIHGGIFYFLDARDKPMEKLEWDQKLWWVHLEALVFLSKSLKWRHDESVKGWFEKVHMYTWEHFPDPENGEWFGYLKRSGEPLSTMKGGKWKGCFHVPRGLHNCWKALEEIGW